MELKKNPKVDYSKDLGLYFAIGLAIAVTLSWGAINYKKYIGNESFVSTASIDRALDEDVEEFTHEEEQPQTPPESQPQEEVQPDDIKEVKDNVKVDTNIAGTDTSKDDKVPDAAPVIKKAAAPVEEEDIDVPFVAVEQKPIFPGCEGLKGKDQEECFKKSLDNHVIKNFKYPEEAQEMNLQGRVTVLFKINKDGSVSISGIKGPHKILEDEARRIIMKLPKFTPGKQQGKAVGVPYAYPIVFKLNT